MIRAANKPLGLIDAAAYYRMSTDKQDKSVGQQREEVEAYAKANGFRIVREYIDEGISGDATKKRLQFQRMVADAVDDGGFSVVLCWDQDRFGRFNSIEAGYWIHPLMQAGIRLVTVAQGNIDWDDFAGRMIYAIQQEGKYQYLVDLARNSTRGRRERALQGKWSGKPPYGYRVGADGRLEFGDPREVETVRLIFKLRVEGHGYGAIARRLNEQGYRSPKGLRWNNQAIRNILERDTYRGAVTTGRTARGKYYHLNGERVDREQRGKTCQTESPTIENAHPAIIDAETWQQTVAMRSQPRRSHARQGKPGAPLAGLLYCGRCGAPMYAVDYKGVGPGYLCSTNHTHRGCGHCKVRAQPMLEAVARKIRDQVIKHSLERLTAAVAARQKPDDAKAERNAVVREIAALDRQIANATDRLVTVAEPLVPLIEQKLLDLQEQRSELEARLTVEKPRKQADPEAIVARLQDLDRLLVDGDPLAVRLALSKIIKRVTLDFEPGKQHGRGQRYLFTGGTIELFTKEVDSPRRRRWSARAWPSPARGRRRSRLHSRRTDRTTR